MSLSPTPGMTGVSNRAPAISPKGAAVLRPMSIDVNQAAPISPKGRSNVNQAPSFSPKSHAMVPRQGPNLKQGTSISPKRYVVAPRLGLNVKQAISISPKGSTSVLPRPDVPVNRGASFSPKKNHVDTNLDDDDDDNSIVIPGVPAAVANTNVETAQMMMAQQLEATGANNVNGSTIVANNNATSGGFGIDQAGNANGSTPLTMNHQSSSFGTNSAGNINQLTLPTKNAAAGKIGTNRFARPGQTSNNSRLMPAPGKGRFSNSAGPKANRQKPSFVLKKTTNAKTPPAANKSNVQTVTHSNMASNSRGIGNFGNTNTTEKVKFAVPEARTSDKSSTDMYSMGGNDLGNNNGQFGASLSNLNTLSNGTSAPSSTAITPDHRRNGEAKQPAETPFARRSESSGGNNQNAVTPTPHRAPALAAATAMRHDSTTYDRVVPGMPNAAAAADPKTMEVVPHVEEQRFEAPPQRRPRSQTIYSPPASTNPDSVTPKASNVNPPPSMDVDINDTNTNQMAAVSYSNTSSAFHTDETFDELLSQFVQDIQDGTDIYEMGQNDLLELDVNLSHAFASVLQYKDDYTNLLGEIEGVQAMAECIMADIAEE